MASRNRPSLGSVAAALALLIPLTFSLISHASAQISGRDAAVVADWLHLSAAMLWSGGLAHLILLVLVLRPIPGDALRIATPDFPPSPSAPGRCWP